MSSPPPHGTARPSDSSEDPETAASPQKPSRAGPGTPRAAAAASGRRRNPTDRLTARQAFYLVVMHGLGAFAISGGINFAVAYGLYTSAKAREQPVRLFQLPNTLVGDAVVTAVAQCIVTWFIEAALVGLDLRGGIVAPVGWMREPAGRAGRWFFGLPLLSPSHDDDGEGEGGMEEGKDRPFLRWVGWVLSQVPRALVLAIASLLIMLGPTVGILTAVGRRTGGDWEYDNVWAPQVYKLLYGGVLGLLVTPIMAFVLLARAGWEIRRATESSLDRQ